MNSDNLKFELSKEKFKDIINKINQTNEMAKKLMDIGIDIYGLPLYDNFHYIAEEYFFCFFNDLGVDLIMWWIYEDVDKFLYDNDGQNVIADLTTIDSLYDYLINPYNNLTK